MTARQVIRITCHPQYAEREDLERTAAQLSRFTDIDLVVNEMPTRIVADGIVTDGARVYPRALEILDRHITARRGVPTSPVQYIGKQTQNALKKTSAIFARYLTGHAPRERLLPMIAELETLLHQARQSIEHHDRMDIEGNPPADF